MRSRSSPTTDALDPLDAADSRDEKAEALYQVGIASPPEADERGVKALTAVLEADEDHKLRARPR